MPVLQEYVHTVDKNAVEKKKRKKKGTRRGNNEGSIYQRSSDKIWVGMVTVGYKADGKPDRKPVYGKTQAEVIRKIAPLRQKILDSGYFTTMKVPNFQALFVEWFKIYKAPTLGSSLTERNHWARMKKHIFPVFGHMDVHNITNRRVQSFLNKKLDELDAGTVKNIK